jgi:HTH-type transcriptional regulator/antitoxin HigA
VRTDLAVHPGEFLGEEIEARGLSQRELADQMRRPYQAINEIIRGRKTITARTALELERVLGITAEYWLNLRNVYELTLARREKATAG